MLIYILLLNSAIVKNKENLQVTKIEVFYIRHFLAQTYFSYKVVFTRYGMKVCCFIGMYDILFQVSVKLIFLNKKGPFEKSRNIENRRATTDLNSLTQC